MSPVTIAKVTHIWKGGKVTESLGRDLKMLTFLDLFPTKVCHGGWTSEPRIDFSILWRKNGPYLASGLDNMDIDEHWLILMRRRRTSKAFRKMF